MLVRLQSWSLKAPKPTPIRSGFFVSRTRQKLAFVSGRETKNTAASSGGGFWHFQAGAQWSTERSEGTPVVRTAAESFTIPKEPGSIFRREHNGAPSGAKVPQSCEPLHKLHQSKIARTYFQAGAQWSTERSEGTPVVRTACQTSPVKTARTYFQAGAQWSTERSEASPVVRTAPQAYLQIARPHFQAGAQWSTERSEGTPVVRTAAAVGRLENSN